MAWLEITGRTLKPWYWKIQPWWWLYNSDEPSPPAWYKPELPQWQRVLRWYIRNPMMNFTNYVIGFSDRNYWVWGQVPVDITDWNDIGMHGFKFSILKLKSFLWFPYISYSGQSVLWHVGWQPGGNLVFKFNLLGLKESPF